MKLDKDDVHDEIVKEAGNWKELKDVEKVTYVVDQDPVNQAAVACEVIADVERLLYILVEMPEGEVVLRDAGWEWVQRHFTMSPRPQSWLVTRQLGGTRLRYVAEEALKKPEWVRHVDQVKACAMDLLTDQPDFICSSCVWIGMFMPEHSNWSNQLLSRLVRLDKRLLPEHDWTLEASLLFGEISAEMEDEALKKLNEAEKMANEAREELERVSKPKFV